MDGGSTDRTISTVHAFNAQARMEMKIVSEKDHGIYDAINKGIQGASGQWIYVLGTDDRFYSSSTLEEVAAHLDSQDNIVYGNVKVVGDAGWVKDGQVHDGEFPISKLVQRNICQQAVFYNARVFRQAGYFNENYKVCADWDFILRCAARYKLKYIDLIIANFYGGGASGSGESEKFYNELPLNLYKYFGRRILHEEFRPVSWRFAKAAEAEKSAGHWWRARIFRKAGYRTN